ncbi:nuclear protein 96-domain-containing protein [Xylariaceae sp. FL0804]|nr:nuclear protein 96-domain-containing protein [Xylariaceae sp. FL0804]
MPFGSGGFGSAFGGNTNNTSSGFGGFGGNTASNTNSTGFGANTNNAGTGFGSTSGGGLFGSGNTSSGFGSTTGGFGASANTNTNTGFGAKPGGFGNSSLGGSTLFGSTSGSTTGGGFGGFGTSGNTTSTSTPFGGGGTGSSLFGSNTAKPAFGAGTGTSGGLFGGGSTSTSTPSTFGSFGNTPNNPASTALGPVGDPPGTANITNFQPKVEKESATSAAMNSFQNVLFNDPYQKWSADELRLVDYSAARRYGGASGGSTFGSSGFGGFGSNTNTSNTFGNTNANANTSTGGGLFGGTQSTGGFGQTNTNSSGFGGTGGTSGGLFGNKPAASTSGGLFGNSTTTQPAQTGGLFGSGTSGFGNTANSGNAFGSTSTNTGGGGLFGGGNNNANQQKPGGLFGSTNNTASTGTGLFGNANNTSSTPGGLFGSSTATTGQNTGGGLFGNSGQQNNSGFGGGGGAFGQSTQPATGGGLFGGNQQKPAGGLFGSTNTANTGGGGLFGSSSNNTGAFGQSNANQPSGGLFGNKPATGTGGLFGNSGSTQNTNTGGLFGSLGQNQNQQQQPQQGSSLFGGLGQNQQKPGGMFGSSTQAGGGGLFGGQNNQQSGGLFGNPTQQQPQNNMGSSLFGGTPGNQSTPQALTASINDPSAYGSLFANLGGSEATTPGPLATPTNKRSSRRPSILPYYKLNPASASRFVTPQKRGYGFSYSTYGTPNSPSSAASTPGAMSQSLLGGGSLSRSLGKSVSTSNLRRNFNIEDSLLAPGAFSASSGPRYHGGNNVKKLVINKDLRSDLFSTPPKDKASADNSNSARKLNKRVSFDTSNVEAIEDGDAAGASNSSPPSAEQLGYVRPKATNGVNGSKADSSSAPETEHVKGNELAVVHENEVASPPVRGQAVAETDGEPGDYWMSPSKEEIQDMNRVQRQKVADFTVGRDHIGYVKFKVPVDLTSVDLDNICNGIVVLVPRTATVYPNPAKKPAVGKGLNVPALINLENAWPRASRTGKVTSVNKHVERLKKIPNTKLENYNADTGEWTFSVEHFTTYGLEDSDDEESEPVPGPSKAPSTSQRADGEAVDSEVGSDRAESLDMRTSRMSLPGTFNPEELSGSEEEEMTEVARPRSSFLGSRSADSAFDAVVPMDQDGIDDEYDMSEAEEDASASLGHHLAAEHDDNSFGGSQVDVGHETPAGIMRARMRAIKGSATPMKVQVASGDDWMDTLSKTISPQKRDRAFLRSMNEANDYRLAKGSEEGRSPAKKRVVTDSKGFATSIDLMNSLFENAKMPAENLQSSVRPKGLKWPYKRMTKNLDENEMDSSERTWHDTMRPTWGPNGTLVFAATPTSSAFGRSGRITEKNGLMMVMKGGVVSESQDICIARFTNEMSAKAVNAQMKLSQVEVVGNVPTVQLNPRTTLKDFSTGSAFKNSAEEHERLVWELASVLFDSIKIPSDLQNDEDAPEKLRRQNLSRLWEHMVDERTNKAIAMAGSSEEKALASLSGHRVPEACRHLLEGKNFRLATLISLIGTNDDVKREMREQIKEWQDANVLSEFSQPIRALYEMLSGNVCVCEGSKGAMENRTESFLISERFGLNWQQAFGLRLWYAISAGSSIADAVERYQEDVEQDKELRPAAWFLEAGIKSIWTDPLERAREDLLWGLLKLYSGSQADLEAVLRPENSQLSPLDYRLCWQLGQALTSIGKVSFGRHGTEKADTATVSFAAQLTNEGSWLEATFVLLHLTNPDARSRAIQEHLGRHAGLIGDGESPSFKKLTQDFKIPAPWIWHAKALYMRSVRKDPTAEVQCLLRAGSWSDAHRTFIKEVAPVAIIERDYDALADVLQQFEGRQAQVPDWNLGGEVYKAFLQLMGCRRRAEQPPARLVNGLLEGLPAMHGNAPEAGITEYAALTDMAAEVAKAVTGMARVGEMEHERILQLPLTEDVLLKHSRDLAWGHYTAIMAGR